MKELLKYIEKAITENKDISENGLTIKVDSKDNSLYLFISYEAQEKAKEFREFLETIDDNLFLDVCEYLGEDEIYKIQKCILSVDLESIKEGISKFKNALSVVSKNKIDYLLKFIQKETI